MRELSFELRRGDFLCVAGPNGAGKTTLLQCLLGILKGGEGGLRVAGRPVGEWTPRELALLMAYVPQAGGRDVPYAVEDFLLLARYARGGRFTSASTADWRAARGALALTGMEPFARRPVFSLSGGERQKVFIAAALAQEAPLLLLDEPLAFLDPRHQAEVSALLRRLNRGHGRTVVTVTHDIHLGIPPGSNVLALREGSSAYFGPAAGFLTEEALASVYGVPFDVVEGGPGRPPRVFCRELP